MKKYLRIGCQIILVVGIAMPLLAGSVTFFRMSATTGGGEEPGGSYDDITFYHDADATDDANYAVGSAVLSFGAGILIKTGVVGNAWDQNDDGYDNVAISTPSNLDWGGSRLGFYYIPQEIADGYIWHGDTVDNYVMYVNATTTRFEFGGIAEDVTTSLSAGTTYFMEFVFSGTSAEWLIDGASVQTISGATEPSVGLTFFAVDNNAWDAHIDQVFISSNTARDLNAIKDCTNCYPGAS